MEEWIEIPDFPNYLISDYGRVYSKKRDILLTPRFDHGGYLLVNLYNDRGMATKVVHRLVAKSFLFGDTDNFEVNHKDGDKTNNFASNLELVTSAQNHRHAFDLGLRNPKFRPQPVRCLNTGECFESISSAAREYGLSSGNIAAVIRGRAKHTGGLNFELINQGGD